jgi:hypothetical protein
MDCSFRLKDVAAALLLSCFIAAIACALTSPVAANNAAASANLVNRDTKADRLPQAPIVQPTQRNSISTEKPTPAHTLPGCEPAFSPLVHPARTLLTYCTA